MNFRVTAVLFGIVFVIGIILLILTFRDDDKPGTGDVLAQELVLAGAKPPDVDSIEFERADGTSLLIVRTDKDKDKGVWYIQKPLVARADTGKVLRIVEALMKAKPTPYNELTSNPAAHGLEPPGVKVTIRQGERSSTINLGDVTLGEKGVVFVTTSSQSKRPMAVRRAELDALFRDDAKDGPSAGLVKWTSDFRTPNVFPTDSRAMGQDVAFLKLELPNKKQGVALSRPQGQSRWKFDSPAGWGEADDEGDPTGAPDKFTGVNPLLRALANVAVLTPADFIDQPGDLGQYGLNPDNPDRVRVEMRTTEGQTAVVYLGKMEAGKEPPPPPMIPGMPPHPPMGGKVYLQIEGQAGVIRASAANLGGLAAVIADPSALRDRDLLRVERPKQVDGIDILLPGQTPDKPTKLRKDGPWKLYGGPGDPQPASDATVQKLLSVLTAKRAIKDFPAPNPANFAAIAATLYVWVDGFNPPPAANPNAEPVKKAEPVKIEFGRVEGETIYVRRTLPGQPPSEFTLPASVKVSFNETVPVMDAVAKTRLLLLDPNLPSFSETTPVKIAVSGANNYVLVKDKEPDPVTKEVLWRFAEPPAQKGQVADGAAVRDLITLLATSQSAFGKFIDESPGNPAADYTLAPPRLKVVVSTDANPANDRGYEFGKDTSDPDKVFARVVGRQAVFTIQRRALDRFANPDLRDRVLFRAVPAGQVNRIELKGWGHLIGKSPITVILEKNKDGAWVVPPAAPGAPANAPAGFVPDAAKVNAFLTLLATSRAKTFEPGPPNVKHGFGDPDQFLEVKLAWPGGAAALNLGATPDAGATYYGWSAWLPQSDPVFTIDGALFKPYKDKPGGFAK